MYFYQQAEAWQASAWQYQEYSSSSWQQQAPGAQQAWQLQQAPRQANMNYFNFADYSDASDSDDEQPSKATLAPAPRFAEMSKCAEEPLPANSVSASTMAEPAAEPVPLSAEDGSCSEVSTEDSPFMSSFSNSEPDAEMEANGAKVSSIESEVARRKTTMASDASSLGEVTSMGSDVGDEVTSIEDDEDSEQTPSEKALDISSISDQDALELPCDPRAVAVNDLLLWRFAAAAEFSTPAGLLRAEVVEEKPQEPQQPQQPQPQPQQPQQQQGKGQRQGKKQQQGGKGGRGDGSHARRQQQQKEQQKEKARLRPSATSWVAQQRTGSEDEDAKVLRSIKSILNKLTIEKFASLYQQLIECGIMTSGHVEYLIQEIFEKATTQHHFIDMYADMCAFLHEHFYMFPIGDDVTFGFKRLLLTACQNFFERYLLPPVEISKIEDAEERRLAETRYKMQMLGNIKFVGALLTRKMLASKVMLTICEELLNKPTPEALESVAALLTVVGPTFDRPEFPGRVALSSIFHRLRALIHKPDCDPRSRCLVKDVLDLRAEGWREWRPKMMEGPTTLREIARRASADTYFPPSSNHGISFGRQQPPSRSSGSSAGGQKKATAHSKGQQQHQQQQAQAAAAAARQPFDRDAFRAEVQRVLRELRLSLDEAGAAARLAEQANPPAKEQAEEVRNLLAQVTQEAQEPARKAGFRVALGLFARWKAAALSRGLRAFLEQDCEDLRVDVPTLPSILRLELSPLLQPFLSKGLLQASAAEALRSFA